MLTYSQLKPVMAEEMSRYANQYNINIKIGKANPPVKQYILASRIYKLISRFDGDESTDTLSKSDIQRLIRLFNNLTKSTIQIDYET